VVLEDKTSFGGILAGTPFTTDAQVDGSSFQGIRLVIFSGSVSLFLHRHPHITHSTLLDLSPHLFSYTSVILLITGSYAFWKGTGSSDATCRQFSFIPPVFKCVRFLIMDLDAWLNYLSIGLQTMVVQLILGWRYALSFVIREHGRSS
jgi:hypothetical protein